MLKMFLYINHARKKTRNLNCTKNIWKKEKKTHKKLVVFIFRENIICFICTFIIINFACCRLLWMINFFYSFFFTDEKHIQVSWEEEKKKMRNMFHVFRIRKMKWNLLTGTKLLPLLKLFFCSKSSITTVT